MTEAFHKAYQSLQSAKTAYDTQLYPESLQHLQHARVEFLTFPSYFSPDATHDTALQETLLVREAMEYVCLCHARTGDVQGFTQGYLQLTSYYTDFPGTSAYPSAREHLLHGLYLTALLVGRDAVAFHTALESLPRAGLATPYVQPIIELERFLAEGSYNKLRLAQHVVPTSDYEPFLHMLCEAAAREVEGYLREAWRGGCKGDGLPASGTDKEGVSAEAQENGESLPKKVLSGEINFVQMGRDYLKVAHELQKIV